MWPSVAVRVFERDAPTGGQLLKEVRGYLPPELPASVEVVEGGVEISPVDFADSLLLVAPRLWHRVPDPMKIHPRVLEARYLFEGAAVGMVAAGMGSRFGGSTGAVPSPTTGALVGVDEH